MSLVVLGCDEESEQASTVTDTTAAGPALPKVKWLDVNASAKPEQWLASREANTDLDERDASVVAMREVVDAAAQRFGESPRMIVNRAVQLEEMLADSGISESAPNLITDLASAVPEKWSRAGFGSVCEHYYNLRKQGLSRDAALERLRTSSLVADGNKRHA